MLVMVVAHEYFKFFHLLRFIINSSVHDAFSLSIGVHEQNIGFGELMLKGFDTGVVKKVKKISELGRKNFLAKNTCILISNMESLAE